MNANTALRRAILAVALLNFAYFVIEFLIARSIGSVALAADSIDFLEDAAVNFLILVALGWTARQRSLVGRLLSIILLLPSIAALWTIVEKINTPVPPSALPLTLAALGALTINLTCAFILAYYRSHSGSLTRAAFLSARNDAIANIAIIIAGGLTAATLSFVPDLIVGIGVLLMNADAARQVWVAAQAESQIVEASRS